MKGEKRRTQRFSVRRLAKGIYVALRIDRLVRFICLHVWKTNRRKVVFSNFWGGTFADNPKYVALELLRRGIDADFVWLARDPAKVAAELPDGIRVVGYGGVSGLREMATAAVRVDNQINGPFLVGGYAKKPDQQYIQTWHGSLGLKRIGFDFAEGTVDHDYRLDVRRRDGEMVDYLVSNSSFESEIYRRQWFGGGKIVEFGHPRNDMLVNGIDAVERHRIRAALGLGDEERVLLYAPTFRDDGANGGCNLHFSDVLDAARERFGGNWRLVVRRHPKMSPNALPVSADAVDATDYPDMQEILSVVDAMVTDYSSCICDFLFTGRPAFIYAPDREEYDQSRGFYYPLEETPFPIAETGDALCANIRSFDAERYKADTAAFLVARGCVEDGHAAERVADLIAERMGAR